MAWHDVIGGDVHAAAVHLDMAVPDELARRLAARREPHPVDDVVEAGLEGDQQVRALDARLQRRGLERIAELALGEAVHPLHLLLLPELLRVLRRLPRTTSALLPVLAGGIGTALDRTLLGKALGALQEQLGSLAAALTAAGPCIA